MPDTQKSFGIAIVRGVAGSVIDVTSSWPGQSSIYPSCDAPNAARHGLCGGLQAEGLP